MRIIPGFIIREIAGETIVVPTGEASRKLSGIITLNECARFLFELLQTERTEEDLTAALLDEYEITPSQAAEDVAEFVSQLRQKGFLTDNQSN
ncbi:MAG: PqqD family protein [Clostridia bacterium]|nr:PqqD family protein [Clostridia bacterium]